MVVAGSKLNKIFTPTVLCLGLSPDESELLCCPANPMPKHALFEDLEEPRCSHLRTGVSFIKNYSSGLCSAPLHGPLHCAVPVCAASRAAWARLIPSIRPWSMERISLFGSDSPNAPSCHSTRLLLEFRNPHEVKMKPPWGCLLAVTRWAFFPLLSTARGHKTIQMASFGREPLSVPVPCLAWPPGLVPRAAHRPAGSTTNPGPRSIRYSTRPHHTGKQSASTTACRFA